MNKKLTNLCIVNTEYTLLMYLVHMSPDAFSNTFFILGDSIKKEIADRERHTQACGVQDQPAGKRQTRRHCRCSDENETTVVIHQIQRKQHPFGCGKHEGWP